MNRVEAVQRIADRVISKMESEEERKQAYLHAYGAAECCAMLAARRGVNTEIAYISGLLHDLYAYQTGSYMCHAPSGADMAGEALRGLDFTDEEKIVVQSAIFHHAYKELVHDVYDEILKDADVLQPFYSDSGTRVSALTKGRLEKTLLSLGIPLSPAVEVFPPESGPSESAFRRERLAEAAQKLTSRGMRGEAADPDFMEIIRYFPEDSVQDDLAFGWGAAFVYHCALKAGLEFPVRFRPASRFRFSRVEAWLEWGQEAGLCFTEKDGETPARGDLVIRSASEPRSREASIGVVLTVEAERLTVAQGPFDRQNLAGLTEWSRSDLDVCYLRIPDGCLYDGWKYDYKTQQLRMQVF